MKVVSATKGPWQVEQHAPLRDGQHYLEVATPHTLPDGGYPMLICTVQPTSIDGDRGPDPEQQANAALIAAAPGLLDAAREMVRHWDLSPAAHPECSCPVFKTEIEELRGAIEAADRKGTDS